MLAVADACIAAQNAVIAAQSLGISFCYIGDIMEHCEVYREALRLPNDVFPAAMLMFGYPTPQQIARVQPPRCALKHIVHENQYRRMDRSELEDMLRKNSPHHPFEAWIQAFCDRKYHSAFSMEMNRSVRKHLAAFDVEGQNQERDPQQTAPPSRSSPSAKECPRLPFASPPLEESMADAAGRRSVHVGLFLLSGR